MKTKDEKYWTNMKEKSQTVLGVVLVSIGVFCIADAMYICGKAVGFNQGCKFCDNVTKAALTAEERTELGLKLFKYIDGATPDMCRALFH